MKKILLVIAAFAVLCAPATLMAKSPRFKFSCNFDCTPFLQPQPVFLAPVVVSPQPVMVAVPCPPPQRYYETETIIRERYDQFGSSYHKERRVYPQRYAQRPSCPYCH